MKFATRPVSLLAMLALAACGSPSTIDSSTSSGTGGATTGTSSATSTTATGTGGAGGAAPSNAKAHRGADFVAAGNRSTDSTRVAISSLGQSPGGNGVSRSPKYQFVGGLVASTQP
jgi:hypothetical protein